MIQFGQIDFNGEFLSEGGIRVEQHCTVSSKLWSKWRWVSTSVGCLPRLAEQSPSHCSALFLYNQRLFHFSSHIWKKCLTEICLSFLSSCVQQDRDSAAGWMEVEVINRSLFATADNISYSARFLLLILIQDC